MSTSDRDFKNATWEEAKAIIGSGQINQFGRIPSELRRYHQYCDTLKQEYGSILYFMQHHRLHWPTIDPTGDVPWANPADYKILYNDWPYALEADIKHVIVWTKFPIGEEDDEGRLTADSIATIEKFVTKTFCQPDGQITSHPPGVNREDLIWFKNWKSLRSVKAIADFLRFITNGDIPMSEKLVE